MAANPTAASAFHIEECTPASAEADVEAFVAIYLAAFSAATTYASFYPPATCPRENQAAFLRSRFRLRLGSALPGMRHFKLIETASGRVASFGRWSFPHPATAEEKAATDEDESPAENAAELLPGGANVNMCLQMFNGLDAMQKKYVDGENMYLMGLLGTDPEFQRRGCGTMLLKHVLDMADAEGRRTYIEASSAGFELYKKLGWKVIDKLEFEIEEKYVVEGETMWYNWIMMREPVLKN